MFVCILRGVLYDVSLYFNICRWPPSNKQCYFQTSPKDDKKKLQRSNRYSDALSAPLGENNEREERKVAAFCTIIIEGVR